MLYVYSIDKEPPMILLTVPLVPVAVTVMAVHVVESSVLYSILISETGLSVVQRKDAFA